MPLFLFLKGSHLWLVLTTRAVTNAARTQLMALEECVWHEPFFKYFSMRASALPQIVTNAEVGGP